MSSKSTWLWPQLFLKCARNTTHHGINHGANAKRKTIRFFWAIIVIGCYCFFSKHLTTLVYRYCKFEVSTSIKYQEAYFEFPDVSFCNLQPCSLRMLELRGGHQISALQHNSGDLMGITEEGRLPKSDFILYCRYNDEPCDPDNFQLISDPLYQQCYAFRPKNRTMKRREPDIGLNVILFNDHQHNHTVPELNDEDWESAGVRVIVHEPLTHPHPRLNGFDVNPGTWMKVRVQMQQARLLGKTPGSTKKACQDERDEVSYCNLHSPISETYRQTEEDCYIEHLQAAVFSKCGCVSETHCISKHFCVNRNLEHCGQTAESRQCASAEIARMNAIATDIIAKNCSSLCTFNSWSVQHSETDWPPEMSTTRIHKVIKEAFRKAQQNNVMSALDETAQMNHSELLRLSALQKNLVKITIFPDALTGNLIVEQDAYPLSSLFGEIGGILGLYLGCSVLTFFEPISYFVNFIVAYACFRRKHVMSRRSTKSVQKDYTDCPQSERSGFVTVDLEAQPFEKPFIQQMIDE